MFIYVRYEITENHHPPLNFMKLFTSYIVSLLFIFLKTQGLKKQTSKQKKPYLRFIVLQQKIGLIIG